MGIKDSTIEAIKTIVGVAIGAAATVIVSDKGVSILFSAIGGKVDTTAIQALALATGYVVWKAIVPVIDDLFNAAKSKVTNANVKSSNLKKYLAPV